MVKNYNQKENPKTTFVSRALLFDYLSLACILIQSLSIYFGWNDYYIDQLWIVVSAIVVFSAPVMVIVVIVLAIIGIKFGLRAAKNHEKHAIASIVFSVSHIPITIGLMSLFDWRYISG